MASIQEKVDAIANQQPEKVSQTAYICYVASLASVALSLILWFIPTTDEAKKARGVGWVYVTPDVQPNPYDTLPADPYWSAELAAV